MAIRLEKGQRINLEKNNGSKLTSFCVGCNWGAIEKKTFFGLSKETIDVDLDLSCVMFNEQGEICDHIYSPLYKPDLLSKFGLPPGKVDSLDRALHHSGDDLEGDKGGDDGLDNEIITVDLNRLNPSIHQIYFFLNNCGQEDFSQIPYAVSPEPAFVCGRRKSGIFPRSGQFPVGAKFLRRSGHNADQ